MWTFTLAKAVWEIWIISSGNVKHICFFWLSATKLKVGAKKKKKVNKQTKKKKQNTCSWQLHCEAWWASTILDGCLASGILLLQAASNDGNEKSYHHHHCYNDQGNQCTCGWKTTRKNNNRNEYLIKYYSELCTDWNKKKRSPLKRRRFCVEGPADSHGMHLLANKVLNLTCDCTLHWNY